MTDVSLVGGKNASLGEMISQLTSAGIRVPNGFATTTQAFRDFFKESNLDWSIAQRLSSLKADSIRELSAAGSEIRSWILKAPFSATFKNQVEEAFSVLDTNGKGTFAVRSSATAEDLPDASFAGQQETFLNVTGIKNVLDRIHHVFASLYSDRAISYRIHKGYSHNKVALSVGIQRMIRSDKGSSGVMFTIDTESGFKNAVFITSSYGCGEAVVQGAVNPDEFYVFKPKLKQGFCPIISRRIGSKSTKMVFSSNQEKDKAVYVVSVPISDQHRYSLSDDKIVELANYAITIEEHYGCPMDIEWGLDGEDHKLYILQARPETVKSQKGNQWTQQRYRYRLRNRGRILVKGRAIGQKIGSGTVRILKNVSEMGKIEVGHVLVTDITDPNWEPIMKRAAAIVTNRGGRTCHAAIIARELGIPAIVGCGDATSALKDNQIVTVSCAEGDEGYVYDGIIESEKEPVHFKPASTPGVKIMMNISNPQLAFEFSQIPNEGVGLARLEFIINNIGIHPKAVLDYPNINGELRKVIESASHGYTNPRTFFKEKLAEGIATIAAAFWPKPVIVRLSDFKSNEYHKLLGGDLYEPKEENPMLGFRGVSRYISEDLKDCFSMECDSLKKVRDSIGLTNVEIMVPFVRTLEQAEMVIYLLSKHGLVRGRNGLRIIMMCEVPSNAILADEFLKYFDGFSIGSNDITQLTLGLDRDSGIRTLATDFDEQNEAVKFMLRRAIKSCLAANKYVGICGQGPSDYPEFAQWLRNEGITSISLNPDSVMNTWQHLIS